MHRKSVFVAPFVVGTAVAMFVSSAAYSASDKDGKHHHAGEDGNPLIEEMVVLDGVFREVVSAVAVGDGHRVHEALEKMHGTMERSHEGIRHDTVTLRKNAGRLGEFIEQDKQFHAKLEALAMAAHRNDGDAMLSLTKDLLDRCAKCHRDFRKP